MKTRHVLAAVIAGAMALVANGASAQLVEKPKRPGPTKPVPPGESTVKEPEGSAQKPKARQAIDIRPTVKQMLAEKKIKSGKNLVHTSDDGVKLWLVSANNRVVGWEATDRNGKSLPVSYHRTPVRASKEKDYDFECEVCTVIGGKQVCYKVECLRRPLAKDLK